MNDATMRALDRSAPAMGLLIGGEEIANGSGGVFFHVNPVTGQVQAEIPLAGPDEIDRAVDAAAEAYIGWRATAGSERRRLLLRLADLIELNAVEFGRRSAIESGIPIAIGGHWGPIICAEWIRYYAGFADKIEGHLIGTHPSDDFAYVTPEPYGVIGTIITWNGPLISLGMKVPAALAAGNTVVIKPSELSPFVPALFGRLVKEAGFPDGVVNVVPGGIEAGERLVNHPKVDKISFTGGPSTAKRIMHACADLLRPVVLELGGKAVNIVFADADLDAAALQAVNGSLGVLSGQSCAMPSRVVVHETVHDAMLERMIAIAETMKIGDPFDSDTVIGPLINEAAAVRVLGLIDAGIAGGRMQLKTGGKRVGGDFAAGAFIEPTIFANVDTHEPLAQNEIFGPVVTVHKFSTEAEAIEIGNSTAYGLGGYMHTNDLRRAHRVAAMLKTGNVWINDARTLAPQMPFGGFGVSGFGREGGRAGLDEFLRFKGIAIGR